MGEIIDKVKGKAKQIEGILTGDKARQQEGELDEAEGKVKGVLNKVDDAVHKVADVAKQAVKKV